MGAWSVGITGNDTAKDLYTEYTAAFFKYDVEEAVEKIERFVREEMFDESDPEEWCNYVYSLADFMWKKGILTEGARNRAIEMIDSGFGLEIWEEAGEKTLNARKKKLEEFKEKLLSPQPAKKKIKPDVHMEKIFEDGDIVAVQLQTAGKPYTESSKKAVSQEDFHALDGKYVLMQLINCTASWTSWIVPEIRDYWAQFRLLDGIYDSIPENIDADALQDAMIQGCKITSVFTCESSMFYFKKRNYRVIENRKDLSAPYEKISRDKNRIGFIFWGINKPWANPDSDIVAAMGMRINCGEFTGSREKLKSICNYANICRRRNYSLSNRENEAIFARELKEIMESIERTLAQGGKLYGISFCKEIGIVTVLGECIDHLYIEGRYQGNGFGTRLLEYAFSCAGHEAYIDVPSENKRLLRVCEKIGLKEEYTCSNYIRMKKPEKG